MEFNNLPSKYILFVGLVLQGTLQDEESIIMDLSHFSFNLAKLRGKNIWELDQFLFKCMNGSGSHTLIELPGSTIIEYLKDSNDWTLH